MLERNKRFCIVMRHSEVPEVNNKRISICFTWKILLWKTKLERDLQTLFSSGQSKNSKKREPTPKISSFF